MMPKAGDMKSPVLRRRILAPYVPLRLNQVRTSCVGIRTLAQPVYAIYVLQVAFHNYRNRKTVSS